MRRKYRSQAGIILDVLEVIYREGPLNATRISQLANVPYDRLKVLLEKLVEQGILEVDEDEKGRRMYRLTLKGIDVLKKLREVRALMEMLGYKL